MNKCQVDQARDDGYYTAAEEERMARYGDRALEVYEAAMARLEEWAPDLAEVLLALEPVSLVPYRDIGLAAVGFVDDEGTASLVLNVESFSTLATDEAAFVLAHEASHVVEGHHLLPAVADREARFRRGIAQDVVINDRLLRRGLKRPPLTTFRSGELVGRDCADLEWEEVLLLLPEEIPTDPTYYLRRLKERR